MPRDYEDRLRAELLSRTRGTGTAERVLRAAGLSMPRGIRSQRGKLSSPRRANAAAGAVVPVQQGEAGRVANAAMDVLADLERALRELGITPRRAIEPQPAVRLPSRRADAAGHVAVAERTSPASPDPGTAGPAPLANCDEQGRLILPDRTEYIERIRRGMTWAEMAAKGRV